MCYCKAVEAVGAPADAAEDVVAAVAVLVLGGDSAAFPSPPVLLLRLEYNNTVYNSVTKYLSYARGFLFLFLIFQFDQVGTSLCWLNKLITKKNIISQFRKGH